MTMGPTQKKILASLENLCARAEYCRSDIYSKALRRLKGDPDAEADAREIVDSLVKNGYVDDSRYAGAFAREKASITGWGPVKIKFALRAKGLASDVIDTALSEIDTESSTEKLRKLLDTKRRSLEGDPQIRLKLIKFALSRGYDYESASKLL